MTPQEKAVDLLNRLEKVGCVAVPEVMEHSAKKAAIICCREMIQELACGKTNSTNEEQEADYHVRLIYWDRVLSVVQKHNT
jgi:hypothetical protein